MTTPLQSSRPLRHPSRGLVGSMRQVTDISYSDHIIDKVARAVGRYTRTFFDVRDRPAAFASGDIWLLLDTSGTAAGFAFSHPLVRPRAVPGSATPVPSTSLYELGIHPAAQGSGLGRAALLALSRVHPEEEAPRALHLVVDAANTSAILFYLHCGLALTTADPVPTRSSGLVYHMVGFPH